MPVVSRRRILSPTLAPVAFPAPGEEEYEKLENPAPSGWGDSPHCTI